MARDTVAATPASADGRRRELEGRVALVTGGAKGIGRLVGELMALRRSGRGRTRPGAIDATVGELNGIEGRVIG